MRIALRIAESLQYGINFCNLEVLITTHLTGVFMRGVEDHLIGADGADITGIKFKPTATTTAVDYLFRRHRQGAIRIDQTVVIDIASFCVSRTKSPLL